MARISEVVREELDAVGCQEILLPALHPVELWERSGRDKVMADVLLSVEGKGGNFVLGPTHEEVVATTMAADLESWRDLPVTVYQIQTKFRDEPRARFGLLRTREFIMADAYSFDASKEAMSRSYEAVYGAYVAMFDRLELGVRPVEASSGAIGGDVNHEFMVPSPIGEDYFASCPRGDYAANLEAATSSPPQNAPDATHEDLVEHHTPGRPGIDLVVEHFAGRGLKPAGMLKCIALRDDAGRLAVALVPGDREVRVPGGWTTLTDEDFASYPQLHKGYIGPMGLAEAGVRVVADHSVGAGGPWVTGANKPDHHVTGATLGRDFTVGEWASIAVVKGGDPCPNCGEPMELVRSVEAAHTFQLGLTYSAKLDEARFVDDQGSPAQYWMGCYGVGVSRLVAVVAESHHDDAGLIWPREIAPYDVHLVSLGAERSVEVKDAAERIYEQLGASGARVLYDDREVSAGVKFADADLLGMPIQLVIGAKGVKAGVVERKRRRDGYRDELAVADVATGWTTWAES